MSQRGRAYTRPRPRTKSCRGRMGCRLPHYSTPSPPSPPGTASTGRGREVRARSRRGRASTRPRPWAPPRPRRRVCMRGRARPKRFHQRTSDTWSIENWRTRPRGRRSQRGEPLEETVPVSHAVHAVAFASEKVPPGHARHLVASMFAYVPAGQTSHFAEPAEETVPSSHARVHVEACACRKRSAGAYKALGLDWSPGIGVTLWRAFRDGSTCTRTMRLR